MAYNEALADRVRQKIADQNIEAVEKKMFGGLAFMINDKMVVGIIKDELMLRCIAEKEEWALEQNGCRPMDFTRKRMKCFLYVDETAFTGDMDLGFWVNIGIEFAFSPEAAAVNAKKKKK